MLVQWVFFFLAAVVSIAVPFGSWMFSAWERVRQRGKCRYNAEWLALLARLERCLLG